MDLISLEHTCDTRYGNSTTEFEVARNFFQFQVFDPQSWSLLIRFSGDGCPPLILTTITEFLLLWLVEIF